MTRIGRWISACAAAMLAAGCGGDAGSGGLTPTGPQLLAGSAATVSAAYGHDGNGSFTSSNATSSSGSSSSVAALGSAGSFSTLSVTIWGPNNMQPNSLCYWYSSVSGGTGPYTYYWYGGSSSNRTYEDFFASARNDFILELKVTDANGNVAWASEYIDVTSNTGPCMM